MVKIWIRSASLPRPEERHRGREDSKADDPGYAIPPIAPGVGSPVAFAIAVIQVTVARTREPGDGDAGEFIEQIESTHRGPPSLPKRLLGLVQRPQIRRRGVSGPLAAAVQEADPTLFSVKRALVDR